MTRVFAAAVASLAVVACQKATPNVWQDPETGCHFYRANDGYLTPRNRADGSQVCTQPGKVTQ